MIRVGFRIALLVHMLYDINLLIWVLIKNDLVSVWHVLDIYFSAWLKLFYALVCRHLGFPRISFCHVHFCISFLNFSLLVTILFAFVVSADHGQFYQQMHCWLFSKFSNTTPINYKWYFPKQKMDRSILEI